MRTRSALRASSLLLLVTLTGCVTKKTVLSNAQGQTTTCETQGRIGVMSGIRLYVKQHDCIKNAEANGYKVTATPTGNS